MHAIFLRLSNIGNTEAVLEAWANADWFHSKKKVPEKISVTVAERGAAGVVPTSAYQAAAKVIQAADNMLATMLEML